MRNSNPPTNQHAPQLVLPPQSIEAEMAVLGSILLGGRKVVEDVMVYLTPERFYRAMHTQIFAACIALYSEGVEIDAVTIQAKLDGLGVMETIGQGYLLALMEGEATPANAVHYAKIVLEQWKLRAFHEGVAGLTTVVLGRGDEEPESGVICTKARTLLDEIERAGRRAVGEGGLRSILSAVWDDLDDRHKNWKEGGSGLRGLTTGFIDLDWITGGFVGGDLIILAGRPSMGKAQPLYSKIRMASGEEKRMGEIAVGDALASVDGAPSFVTGVFPQGKKKVYRVTFSDGRTADACGDHLWSVYFRQWESNRVLTTNEIAEKLLLARYKNRMSIPLHSGAFGEEKDLPIHPYLLGALIGDGCLKERAVRFSNNDRGVIEKVAELSLGFGVTMKQTRKYDYSLVNRKRAPNDLLNALRALGLAGKKSPEKFIPEQYLTASRQQRLSLLQGLMDTDGCVDGTTASFSTSSPQLANDFEVLARSLGYRLSKDVKRGRYKKDGAVVECLDSHRFRLASPDETEMFTLQRHKGRLIGKSRSGSRGRVGIESVECVGEEDCQCIRVSHRSSLYITDNDVVTHNTSLFTAMAMRQAKYGAQVGIASLEMSKESLVERELASMAQVSSTKIRGGNVSDEEYTRLSVASQTLWDMGVEINDTSDQSVDDIRAWARSLVAKGGLDILYIDYLQLIRETAAGTKAEAMGAIAKALKNMARELGIPVVALSQLSRSVERRDDKRPILSDLKDSGDIEAAADVVFGIYRASYYARKEEAEEGVEVKAESEEAEVIALKQRNGATGTVKLLFRPEFVRFDNLARHPLGL